VEAANGDGSPGRLTPGIVAKETARDILVNIDPAYYRNDVLRFNTEQALQRMFELAAECAAKSARARLTVTLKAMCGEPSTCRGCRATIYWATTARGNRMPLNEDGTSHFATCPVANAYRKQNRKG